MKLPQFTLRDLCWLVLVVAMGCGWWLDQSKLASNASFYANVVEDLTATMNQDYGATVELLNDGKVRAVRVRGPVFDDTTIIDD